MLLTEYLTRFYTGFNVFNYLTMRAILSALTALVLSLVVLVAGVRVVGTGARLPSVVSLARELAVPVEFGGGGADLATVAQAQGALARGCASTALAANMHIFGLGAAAED